MVVRRGVDGAGAAFTLYGQGDEPSYGLGTGHHTVCLHLATDISKVPIVRIGVNMRMYCL